MGYIDYDSFDKNFPLRRLLETCIKIDIYDEASDLFIDTITGGITGGNIGINGESDARWTLSLNVIPNKDFDIKIKENNYIWVDKYIKVYIGVYSPARYSINDIQYYPMGKYFPLNNSITYDPTNNQLSVNCSDPVVNLNSTRNGQYGALNTVFPAYYDTQYYGITNYDDNIYSATISSYTEAEYVTGDIFCLHISVENQAGCKVKINSLPALPIYQTIVGYDIEAGVLTPNADEYTHPLGEDDEETDYNRDFGYLFQVMFNPRTNTKYFTMVGRCEQINEIDSVDSGGDDTIVTYFITYHRIRDCLITVLRQLARMSEDEYVVDDIGEYHAMPGYPDYMKYREDTPLWNTIPFDQEFGVGSSIWQIITALKDLYPNYEAYFNYDGIFHVNMIPDAYNDPISIYNDYMKKIYISENTTLDLSVVRNVNLVYGKSIETDFYADNVEYVPAGQAPTYYANEFYDATITSYTDGYFNGDKIALRLDHANTGPFSIRVVATAKQRTKDDGKSKHPLIIPVFDDNFDTRITEPNVIQANQVYVFKIIKKRDTDNKTNVIRANLLGQFQAVGLCALVSGDKNDEEYTTFSGKKVKVYSEEYFQDVYNCDNVYLSKSPDSPFTCEKIGVRLQVHSGGEFENIDSSSDAIERAKWENYKSARLTDSISLTTKLVPFINDVNFKVQYQPINEDLAHEYMVTSISHDFYGGQTTWSLMRFYEYYIPDSSGEGEWDDDDPVDPSGAGTIYQTWNTASQHTWDDFKSSRWRDMYYKEIPQYIPDYEDVPEEESSSDYVWDDLAGETWRKAVAKERW